MRRAALLGSIAVALVAGGVVGEAQSGARTTTGWLSQPTSRLPELLGLFESRLVRVDPATLRPLPGRGIAVGSGGCASRAGGTACWNTPPWAVSPDAKRLAVATNDVSSVKVVDVRELRVTAGLRWRRDGGSVGSLAWLAPRRIVALRAGFGESQRLIAFDLAKGRITVRRALDGTVTQMARTRRDWVLLVAPTETIGPARIAVADARGAVRFVRLEQILAGSKLLGTGSEHRVDSRMPGLAVDADGRRAFVVAQHLAAEVDLRTLAVSYHSLEQPCSLLRRLWSWLDPVASAKQVSGYHRQARWLGAHSIALSGSDTENGRYQPAGLQILDTESWTLRRLERDATHFKVTGGILLATGSRWDAAQQRQVGTGVAAYAADGTKRFQLFPGEHAWLAELYEARAYVGLASEQDRLRIVELASGAVTGVREPQLPELILDSGSGWWD